MDHENHSLAVQLAEIPEEIRGFGHIKEKHIRDAKVHEQKLLGVFHNPDSRRVAAE